MRDKRTGERWRPKGRGVEGQGGRLACGEGEGSSSRRAEVSVGGEGGWDRRHQRGRGWQGGGNGSSSGSPRCAALMPQHPEVVPSTGGTQKMPAGVTQEGGAGAGGGGSTQWPPCLPCYVLRCQGYLLSCSCSVFNSPSRSFSSCSRCWACSLVFWSPCLRLLRVGGKGREREADGERQRSQPPGLTRQTSL